MRHPNLISIILAGLLRLEKLEKEENKFFSCQKAQPSKDRYIYIRIYIKGGLYLLSIFILTSELSTGC